MTIASMTIGAEGETHTASPIGGIGLLTIATGFAAFALLAAHPEQNARTFAEVIQNEAAGQLVAAIVHGGFIVVLGLQVVCYAVFSGRLGLHRPAAVAGLVFFAIGMAFFCGSLLMDGLVTPAVAARYIAKPDKIESARVLFVLMGTMTSFLMPIGLTFQSAGVAAWGWALAARGHRAAGLFGLVAGGVMVAALIASFALMNPLIMMAAIATTGVWAIVAGTMMLRRSV
jgi:hypothetical protein